MADIILCIETSTDICSVALSDGPRLLHHIVSRNPNDHAKYLTTFINDCIVNVGMTIKDLKAVAIASGPGSYTGLRIGVSTAKGLCYGLDIPMISMDSVSYLGYATRLNHPSSLVISSLDARRDDAYVHIAQGNEVLLDTSFFTVSDESLAHYKNYDEILLCGNASYKFHNKLPKSSIVCIDSDATLMIPIAYDHYLSQSFTPITTFEPNYLKDPNITTPKIKKKD